MTERFGFGAQKCKLIRNIIIKLLHQFQVFLRAGRGRDIFMGGVMDYR